ncbi:hypothetical protein HDU91_001932, partial [Kappamyces sp. JEL0680]
YSLYQDAYDSTWVAKWATFGSPVVIIGVLILGLGVSVILFRTMNALIHARTSVTAEEQRKLTTAQTLIWFFALFQLFFALYISAGILTVQNDFQSLRQPIEALGSGFSAFVVCIYAGL